MATAYETINVELADRSYPIYVGAGLLGEVGRLLPSGGVSRRALIVTDSNVGPLYAARLERSLASSGWPSEIFTVPAGESSKSLSEAGRIYDALAERAHEREELIVSLGGGMVGDLAGFVAATWMRGVPLVHCPTSLEADIDASVGGKTGINHARGKNLIGAFHQPRLVCIDVECLSTLDDRNYRAALSESVKHGIIEGENLLRWHEENAARIRSRDPGILTELVVRNCRVKARIVSEDERERLSTGVGRAALNLGHTIGHAIEAEERFSLLHGEAVGFGLVAALDLAVRRMGLPEKDRERCERLMNEFGLAIRWMGEFPTESVLNRLGLDKKSKGRVPHFVLPEGLGRVVWCNSLSANDLELAIHRLRR